MNISISDRYKRISDYGKRDALMGHFLELPAWTPAMAALLASGVSAPIGCTEIPSNGTGLDGITLSASHPRFHEARRILNDWHDWKCDAEKNGSPSALHTFAPVDFLIWWDEEGITNDWIRLFRLLAGSPIDGHFETAPSPIELLISHPVLTTKLLTPNPEEKTGPATKVHRSNPRVNALTSTIEAAIASSSSDSCADVFSELTRMALEEHAPFNGNVANGKLHYTFGSETKFITAQMLANRLSRRRKNL